MKIIITILIVLLLGFLTFKYITRPVKVNLEENKNTLENNIQKSKDQDYYRIDQAKSNLKFSIAENKSGEDLTIAGNNNQIYGDFSINQKTNELSIASNTITIDARTFKTGNEGRDGAINRIILNTPASGNEYITFTLKNTPVLKSSLNLNTEITAEIDGVLTIAGISKEIGFLATITKVEDGLNINFKTNIKRSDFNIKVPDFPGATVSDLLIIEANLFAKEF